MKEIEVSSQNPEVGAYCIRPFSCERDLMGRKNMSIGSEDIEIKI